ncbi:MAG: chromosomal replication initiator protein DnaA [Spirochaetales bacterium]|nr:MAG: chromosomal replication initiator protein DnaA [Spirochaetales bacterium]
MSEGTWDYSSIWKDTLKQLKSEISPHEISMWLNDIHYLDSKEHELLLSISSNFHKYQIETRYLKRLEGIIHDLTGNTITLTFIINKADSARRDMEEFPQPKKTTFGSGQKKYSHSQLNPEYSFENFIIGKNNTFAANAAIAIAKNPGKAYNPCLIYGGVGLGKTHLAQSIGNYAASKHENMNIVYITAETFITEFINSIQSKSTNRFNNKYRSVDILLIDDIHDLQGKIETQEEVFHTFNALYENKKQLVFTCDRPVSELKNLSDRLKNRFERGLNVDLQPPDYETRFAILKKKIEAKSVVIPNEVIELICTNITSNVRDLESALLKLIAYSELVNKTISLEVAQQQLRDVFSSPKQSNINIEMIQRVVAEYFSLSRNDLKGKKRTKAIVFPRQLAMYITREITEYSTTEVGDDFGGRDHTTVMHACQKIENRMKTDPTLEPIVQNLIRLLKEYSTKS